MADDDDGFVRITLRLPAALHARLNDASAKKRSMNAEIIARLEDSFTRDERDATAMKNVELSRLIDTYNYEAKNFERMQQDIVRMGDHLRRMEQSLREAGVVFREDVSEFDTENNPELDIARLAQRILAEDAKLRGAAASSDERGGKLPKDTSGQIVAAIRRILRADNGEQLAASDASKKAG